MNFGSSAQISSISKKENALFFIEDQLLDSLISIGNYELAITEIERLENYKDWAEKYKINWSYQKLRIYYLSTDYLSSIKNGKKYISLVNEEEKTYQLGEVYIYLGNCFVYMNEYSIAMDYYLKASNTYKDLGLVRMQIYAENNIALILMDIEDYYGAIETYNKGLQLSKKNGATNNANAYSNIARSHIFLEKFQKAKLYLDSALQIAIKFDDIEGQAYVYRNLAWLFRGTKNYPKSEEHYLKAIKLSEESNDIQNIIEASVLLAELYHLEGQYENALKYCFKYVGIAEKQKNLNAVLNFSDQIYNSYVALGKYKDAISTLEKYKPVKDSVEKHRINNSILTTRMRSDAANEVSILKQEKEINNQTIQLQNTLIYVAIIGIIFLILIALIIYRSLIANKKLSALNKKQSERLFQLDAAKSRFFANISHDLRSPLSLIMGSMEQVLESPDIHLTNKGERQLKIGLQNGRRIIHLTNEINELIKLEDSQLKIDKKYINIDQMLSLFVSMFHSMATIKGVKLSYIKKNIIDFDPIVNIDHHQFEKVLFNLITNALKHSKKNDFVNVELDSRDDQLELSIVDSGQGIPKENVPYIFERYYQAPTTTYKTQEGFGIGLALVKEIIDKHGAKIRVSSEVGIGTKFTISLALHRGVNDDKTFKLHTLDYSQDTRELFQDIEEINVEDRPIIVSPGIDTKKKNQTVLLVEDHPEIREYIQDIVEPHYNVLTASNGKRALKVLASKQVDLITTDLMMPWFDGFELLERLSEDELLSKIPVLVLSARNSEEDKERVLSQGINDFLHKPFKSNELLSRIKNLLERKSKWNNDDENTRFINNKKTLNDIERSMLDKVDSMILEKIDDPNLTVPYLASEIAVSERKFFRMIKKLTGTTPFDYIKEYRLQYVKKLMLDKKISTSSEAALHIGMNNVSHFNTQFKSRFGKKPVDIL
ncbi:MAG: response regulator [Reichenbachiella sp.]